MSQRASLPVTARYALLPALAVVLLTAVLLALAQWLLVDELARRTLLRAQHRASTLALELDEALRGSVREVRTLARSPLLRGADAARHARAELEFLQRQSPRYVWIGLVGLDGTVLAGTKGWLEGQSIATRPVFLQSQRDTWLGDVHPAVALGPLLEASGGKAQELLDIGEPVRDADGRVVAVLAAHLGVEWIDGLRAAASGEAQGSPVPSISVHVLTGAAGRSVLPTSLPPEGVPRRIDKPASVSAHDGRQFFAASRELSVRSGAAPLPWRVLVLQEREAALGPAYRVMQSMVALGLLATLLVGLLGYWLARRLLQPWHPVFSTVLARLQAQPGRLSMSEGVEALMGELEPRSAAEPAGPEALLVRLARDARDLRRTIDHLPVGVALIDHDWRVEYVNPAYTRLLGWTTEQVRGRIAAEFLFDAVERAEFVRMFEQLGPAPGEVAARFDALTPTGQHVAVQWHLVPLLGDGERLDGAIAIVQDVRSERVALARADALAGRLRALADAAVDDLLATLDLQGRVLEWSRGAERLTSHPAPTALGRPLGDVLRAGEAFNLWLLQARRDGVCRIDAELMTGDGRLRWFEGSLYALGLASGSARFGVILRDVSAQREAQRALIASEERLRLAIDAAQIGTWEVDLAADLPYLTWSEGYGRTFGVAQDHMPRTSERTYALVHEDDRPAVKAAFRATVKDDAPLQLEFRVRGEGGLRWHLIRGRSQRGPDGRVARIVGVGMDVTARRFAEMQLHDERSRLERILQTMAEGLIIMSAEGRYGMVNAAAAAIFGVEAEHLIGLHFEEVPWRRWSLDGNDDGRYPLQRLIDGEAAVRNLEVGIERPDGTRRAISLNAHPLFDERGRLDGMVATFVDITERHKATQALSAERERLESVLQTMAEGLIIVGTDGRYQMVNRAAAGILGMAQEKLVGQAADDVPRRRHVLDAQDRRLPMERLLAGEPEVRSLVMGIEAGDGTRRVISLNARPQPNAQGEVEAMVATFVDITERREAQQSLADSRARLSAIIDSASDAIVSTDVEGRIALFNPAAERIFGHDAASMQGRTLDRLLPTSMHAHHGTHLAAFARSGTSRRAMGAGRVQGRHADGRLLELEAAISQAEVHGQTVLTAILRDVTERVAQERALEITRGELVELTRRLLEQEKQTTRRLAQALHDELGQTLTALRLHWEAMTSSAGRMGEPLQSRVGQLVVAANRQIRSVLGELRPPLLDDFGLAAALDNELQQQRPVDGVPELRLNIAQRLQSQRWAPDVEYAAFMIAREAVLNALHHADAEQVTVRLEGDEGQLLLTVHDDGVGGAPAGRAGHLGLVGMRERALAIAGSLGIESEPDRGTIVTLTWSMPDEPPVPD